MIHWAWIIPALILGGVFGVCTMAMFIAADREDDE